MIAFPRFVYFTNQLVNTRFFKEFITIIHEYLRLSTKEQSKHERNNKVYYNTVVACVPGGGVRTSNKCIVYTVSPLS